MNDLRLEVSIDDQMLRLYRGTEVEREYVVSTAAKGVGFTEGSHRTPTGRFVVVQKIGEGQPAGTIFKSREPVGLWNPGEACDRDLVLTRIIRISGLQPENANTFDRFIYFHGTNQEDQLGTPASRGCIRLCAGGLPAGGCRAGCRGRSYARRAQALRAALGLCAH